MTDRQDEANLRFALHKAPQTIEHALLNLRSLTGQTPLPHLHRACAPAVLIVGAGPTLDLERVRQAAEEGVSIWTVNNAARAVCSVVAPDVVVVRESLDVSHQLDGLTHKPRCVAVDLCAHPAAWAKARDMGGAFFVPATLQTFQLAADLDVAPVYGGTASLTAAVSLAAAGGADWIGLEGVDLAYARDGSGYAPGAQYQATLSRVDGTTATLSGGDAQRDLAVRSGQAPPPMRPTVHLVHAREGAPLHTQGPWLDQIEWLENFAARRPYDPSSWWASSARRSRGLGLADLVGWYADDQRLGARGDCEHDRGLIEGARVVAVLREVERQIDCQRRVIARVAAGGDPSAEADLVDGASLPDTHATGKIMLAHARRHPTMAARVEGVSAAYLSSVDRLAGL